MKNSINVIYGTDKLSEITILNNGKEYYLYKTSIKKRKGTVNLFGSIGISIAEAKQLKEDLSTAIKKAEQLAELKED